MARTGAQQKDVARKDVARKDAVQKDAAQMDMGRSGTGPKKNGLLDAGRKHAVLNGATPDGNKGPRVRMRKVMLDAAMGLMQGGLIPSVSDVAEAAQVSRATAYRYFPTQAALIQAAVDEALGPILAWTSESQDPEERVTELVTFAYPRMESHEATLKAALRLALDQWARRHAGTLGEEAPMVRGHRIELLVSAMRPLKGRLTPAGYERLTQSLSLIFGTEAFVVLKDIWGLDRKRAEGVALWTCRALIQAALAGESTGKARAGALAGTGARRDGARLKTAGRTGVK